MKIKIHQYTIYLNHDLNILNHYGFGPSLTMPLTIRKIKAYNFIGSFSCLFLSLISECKCNLYQFDRSISVFVGTGRPGIRRDRHLLYEVEMYLQKGCIMVSGVGSS